MSEHQIVVHGICDNLGDLGGSKFEESIVFRVASFLAARQTYMVDGTELGEIRTHFVLMKAMRDTTMEISVLLPN